MLEGPTNIRRCRTKFSRSQYEERVGGELGGSVFDLCPRDTCLEFRAGFQRP